MTSDIEIEAWQARNDAYLGAALAWLRQRLEAAAHAARALAVSVDDVASDAQAQAKESDVRAEHAAPPRGPAAFYRRVAAVTSCGTREVLLLASTPPSAPASDAELLARVVAASEGDPPPALPMLARQLGLSDFERDILLMCVALELDTGVAALCAAAQGQADRAHPSFALAMTLFDDPAWEAVSPDRPLRYWRLIEINQPAVRALTASALRADERIVNFVKGLNCLDDRLAPLVLQMAVPTLAQLPLSQRAAVDAISHALGAPQPQAPSHMVVVLRGQDRPSKREVAGATAAVLGMHMYRLPADALPVHAADLETLACLWHRESLLLPLVLYIDRYDPGMSSGPDGLAYRLGRFIARTGGLIFVDARDDIDLPVEPAIALDIARPKASEQQQEWAAAIGEREPSLPALLSTQFDLSRPDIEVIARTAAASATGEQGDTLQERLWRACVEKTRPSLGHLAQRLHPRATWDQLVLPATEMALLEQIIVQVRARAQVYDDWGFRARMNRGLGVSALFAGDSGTGKTMAAEVLANTLQLDLYRIDLSAVVSKYIGETEKNLREVFDAAECGGAILLFDEADALFGKRSEVKDSHDRYANIEIDYLLQRMEAFGGLAILATNMKSALDQAFVRRLRFIVNFPYPDAAQRRQVWERVFPPETPLGVLDYDRLARLNFTGGNIQSIALTAAFTAAHAGTPVTMNLLLEAGRMEMRKLDRPVNEADFRWIEAVGGQP